MKNDNDHITIILDDDPTGTQTVHDVTVLTAWDVEMLTDQFDTGELAFFILTNSRALPVTHAYKLIADICYNLRTAAALTGKKFNIILRSDSTLRGHFPAEADAAEDVLGNADKWLVCPFFEEGGRITMNDTHYIKEEGKMMPVSETPFAKDPSFGYRNSDLKKWIEEKTMGRIKADAVASLSIEEINNEGEDHILKRLREPSKVWIVNVTSMKEMGIVTTACRQLEKEGVRILYRTGASFVQSYLGIEKKEPLPVNEMTSALSVPLEIRAGLVVVGSYVPKTTEQLNHLLELQDLERFEIDVAELLQTDKVIAHAIEFVNSKMREGKTVVLYTSRKLHSKETAEENSAIGKMVSDALVKIVQNVHNRPHFLIAKGGITSSDVATKGLGVKRARIVGQALPGIPVWLLGDEGKFPGLPYIVFPGNVGGPMALKMLTDQLMESVRKNNATLWQSAPK